MKQKSSSHQQYMAEAPLSKVIPAFVLPGMLSMLVVFIYNFTDTAFIAQLGDSSLVAALSIIFPVFSVFMGIGNIFGIGCGTAIARYMGRQQPGKVEQMAYLGVYGSLAAGLILSVAGILHLDWILESLGAVPEMWEASWNYGLITIGGGASIVLSTALGHIVRCYGGSKESMRGIFLGTVANIVLDVVFLFVMGWGIAGVACATVIGNSLSVVYYWRFCMGKSLAVRRPRFKFWSAQAFIEMITVGGPALLTSVVMIVSMIMLNHYAVAYGTAAVAIFGVAIKMNMLPKMLSMGFARGIQPLISYSYGSGNRDRLISMIKAGTLGSCLICFTIGIAVYLFRDMILGIFLHEPDQWEMGLQVISVTVLSMFFVGLEQMTLTILQAMGKGGLSLILSLAQGVFLILALYCFHLEGSLKGLAMALPLSVFLTVFMGGALCLLSMRRLYKERDTVLVAS